MQRNPSHETERDFRSVDQYTSGLNACANCDQPFTAHSTTLECPILEALGSLT